MASSSFNKNFKITKKSSNSALTAIKKSGVITASMPSDIKHTTLQGKAAQSFVDSILSKKV